MTGVIRLSHLSRFLRSYTRARGGTADAPDLGSGTYGCEGSSPSEHTASRSELDLPGRINGQCGLRYRPPKYHYTEGLPLAWELVLKTRAGNGWGFESLTFRVRR